MFRLEITGQDSVTQALAQVAKALSPELILDEAAAVLLSRIRQRYLAELGPDGRPWVPSLAARIRASKGRGGGTLFDTGRLFHSIQEYADTDTSRVIGTDVPYAGYHQFGGKFLPRRPFLGVGELDGDLMHESIVRRVREMLK